MFGDDPGLEILDPDRNVGYLRLPLPSDRDVQVSALVGGLIGTEVPVAGLRREHARVLRAYAERMASFGRTEGDLDVLRLGLDALTLAWTVDDGTEALLIAPLLWRSIEVLGADPRAEFAATGDRWGVEAPTAFASRDPSDRTLAVMGYIETADASGFHYERTW